MCSSRTRIFSLVFVVFGMFAGSCGDDPEFRLGQNVSGVEFVFFSETEGIYPSAVTLFNPNNPFREFRISGEAKFAISAYGGNAGAFYAWATVLANEPIGENQFFAASKLRDLYEANEVAEEDRETVRQMAITGFQTVLDCFPNSLLFDETGTFGRPLATPAYLEILALDGVPEGDWVLVQDSNGNPSAVRRSGSDVLDRAVRCR